MYLITFTQNVMPLIQFMASVDPQIAKMAADVIFRALTAFWGSTPVINGIKGIKYWVKVNINVGSKYRIIDLGVVVLYIRS